MVVYSIGCLVVGCDLHLGKGPVGMLEHCIKIWMGHMYPLGGSLNSKSEVSLVHKFFALQIASCLCRSDLFLTSDTSASGGNLATPRIVSFELCYLPGNYRST